MAGRRAGLRLAHARSRTGGGGALPCCCALPREQIFNIPGLSRGGGARRATFPPPSSLIGLALSGVGTSGQARVRCPETRSRPRTPTYTPRGNVDHLNPLELSTSHSLQAAVSGRESLPSQAPQSLYRSSGDSLQCGFSGQSLGGPLHAPVFRSPHCPKLRKQRPAFAKPRGAAPACFRSVLATPCLCS